MREQDMLNKIAESADSIDVPKELQPESVKERIQHQTNVRKFDIQGVRRQKQPRRWHQHGKQSRYVAVAACLCLCFGLSVAASYSDAASQQIPSIQSIDPAQEKAMDDAAFTNDSMVDDAEPVIEPDLAEEPKRQSSQNGSGICIPLLQIIDKYTTS